MAVIKEHKEIAKDIYVMTLTGVERAEPGQFFMLRPKNLGKDPLLPRPISVMDATDEETRICYRVVGKGTGLLSTLRAGDSIDALGPLGKSFPYLDTHAILVGGGMGIAPLLYMCKVLKSCGVHTRVYLGYSAEPCFLKEEFESAADDLIIDIGGRITDEVAEDPESVYYACGPQPMLEAISEKTRKIDARCYVSLESRMACGVGACLGCTIPTRNGNKRVCKDGPVFDAREVYYVQPD